jgi:hypothetical protein
LKRLHEDPGFRLKMMGARRAARKRAKLKLRKKAIEAALGNQTRRDGDPAFRMAASERLSRLRRNNSEP